MVPCNSTSNFISVYESEIGKECFSRIPIKMLKGITSGDLCGHGIRLPLAVQCLGNLFFKNLSHFQHPVWRSPILLEIDTGLQVKKCCKNFRRFSFFVTFLLQILDVEAYHQALKYTIMEYYKHKSVIFMQ